MKRIKWFILLALLCATLFICEIGCDVAFSSGFVYPYLIIDNYGDLSLPGSTLVSIVINLVFVVSCATLILKIDLEKWKKVMKKVYVSLLINIVVFNITAIGFIYQIDTDNLFIKSIGDVVNYVFQFYIAYPTVCFAEYLHRFLTFLGLSELELDLNVFSRIYFLIATGFIFMLISLFEKVRKKIVPSHETDKQSPGVYDK